MGLLSRLKRRLEPQPKTEPPELTDERLRLIEDNVSTAQSYYHKAVAAGMEDVAVLVVDLRAEVNKEWRDYMPAETYRDLVSRGIVPDFLIPMPRQDLADYLNVGQSARSQLSMPAPDGASGARFWVVCRNQSGASVAAVNVEAPADSEAA